MTNYVVLRRSPDWLTFDLNDTRKFCRDLGIQEGSIVDFAADWNAELSLDYLAYRQGLKDVALACAKAVENAVVIDFRALASTAIADDDLLYFTDDDDWVSSDLFTRLGSRGPVEDGWIWESLAVSKPFIQPVDETILRRRPVSAQVFTNNYAVTGRALKRLGLQALLEHFDAETSRNKGLFTPQPVHEALTAANKHMCCTTFICRPQRGGGPRPAPRAGLEAYQHDLGKLQIDDADTWLTVPISKLMEVNAAALAAA